jgi:hypothetical protein
VSTWSDPSPLPDPGPSPTREPAAGSIGGPASAPIGGAIEGVGLVVVHEALERVVAAHDLRALTVVIDDPDLGRQAFRAGAGPFDPGTLGGDPGWRAEPSLPPGALDGDLLVALCAAALRVEVLRDEGDGPDGLELAIRRLPGVANVVIEHDDETVFVGIDASAGEPRRLARDAARIARDHAAGGPVVVEIVTSPVALPDRPPARPAVDADPAPTIVAVRTVADTAEIEVHLRVRETRTVGRASTTEGLAGAAGATIDALRQAGRAPSATVAWARTVETAPNRSVIAVALQTDTGTLRHGVGTGANPLDAAARAALDAARPDH